MRVGAFFHFEDIDARRVGVTSGQLGDQFLSVWLTLQTPSLSSE